MRQLSPWCWVDVKRRLSEELGRWTSIDRVREDTGARKRGWVREYQRSYPTAVLRRDLHRSDGARCVCVCVVAAV